MAESTDETLARYRAALEKIAATHERNRWHPDTQHPTESSRRWHDGFISCAASHSIIATAALDPEQAAEDERLWRVGAHGSDSDWFAETGHCGHCGIVASACECDGECGCWQDHGPPLKPWGGVLADREAKGRAEVIARIDALADWWSERAVVAAPRYVGEQFRRAARGEQTTDQIVRAALNGGEQP